MEKRAEPAEPLHGNGITWKRFVIELPVGVPREAARPLVPPNDEPGPLFMGNLFDFLVKSGRLSPHDLRDAGRSLARGATSENARAYLAGFATVGLGHIDMELLGEGRYRFTSDDLRLTAQQARAPSCAVALGYCEGLVEQTLGEPALGAETTCRSMGHEACTFVVSLRE